MNSTAINKPNRGTVLKILGLILLFVAFSNLAVGQNTKGDKPSSSREGRSGSGKGKSKKVVKPGRVGGGEGYSPRGRARGGERAGKPLRPTFNVHKPSEKQKAWKGDVTGRRVQNRNANSEKYKPKVYRQTGPNVKRRIPDREGRQNVARGRPVSIPSATGKVRNVYPQKGPYVSNPHSKPRPEPKAVSNRVQLARVKKLQTKDKGDEVGRGKNRVQPRTASRPFMRDKSINVWANFKRPKKKPVKAQTTDIAGRKIRGRNYQTPKPGLIKAPNTYRGRIKGKERPYAGRDGYNKSATQKSKAWIGDITGRGIRHRGKSSVEGTPYRKGSPKSVSGNGRVTTKPVPVKPPGYGATGLGWAGKGKKAGRRANTSGIVVKRKLPGRFDYQGETYATHRAQKRNKVNVSGLPVKSKHGGRFGYQGETYATHKAQKRTKVNVSGLPVKSKLKGRFDYQGETYVTHKAQKRKKVNVSGMPVKSKLKGRFDYQGETYATHKAQKRKRVDVSGIPVKRRAPGKFDNQGENFAGTLKTKRPAKGGGSVSGDLWNNREKALPPRPVKQAELTALPGNYKAKRPPKGGGSVSGKLWNNDESPLPKKPFRGANVAGYSGNIKATRTKKVDAQGVDSRGKQKIAEVMTGQVDQGEEFTGVKRLPRFRKAYIQNKLAHEESLKKQRPEKETYAVEGLQTKVKRRVYVRNTNISKETMDKLKPTSSDRAVAGIYGKVKQYNYVRNPSSFDEALKVREPGKAFARASNYQGNIKMQKYKLFEKQRGLHPDAQFVKTNKNNVRDERDSVTNLKLWWARLFKKQETQPEHLKEKVRKPRYDKGEEGMWYD